MRSSAPVICETLFHRFPDYQEGDLTRIKSIVVSRQTCARVSESLNLAEFLMVGKGMSNSQYPESLMADVLEALLAAVYLDGGDLAVREFIKIGIGPEIDSAAAGLVGENHKSLLQQLSQREYGCTPTYQLIDEKGPDHSKCFKVAVQMGGNRFAAAWGRNKKEAEQRAGQQRPSPNGRRTAPPTRPPTTSQLEEAEIWFNARRVDVPSIVVQASRLQKQPRRLRHNKGHKALGFDSNRRGLDDLLECAAQVVGVLPIGVVALELACVADIPDVVADAVSRRCRLLASACRSALRTAQSLPASNSWRGVLRPQLYTSPGRGDWW